MISADDARLTREFDDRFVILPASLDATFLDSTLGAGCEVDERFNYSSDSNSEWLMPDDLLGMLAATELVD